MSRLGQPEAGDAPDRQSRPPYTYPSAPSPLLHTIKYSIISTTLYIPFSRHTLPHPLHYSTLKHSMVSTTQHIPFLPHLNLYTTNVHVHYVYCTCNIYLSITHSCYQSQMVVYFGHFGLILFFLFSRIFAFFGVLFTGLISAVVYQIDKYQVWHRVATILYIPLRTFFCTTILYMLYVLYVLYILFIS